MIEITKAKSIVNWVLVKPDADFESFQIGGKETNLIAPNYSYQEGKRVSTPSKNFSVTGTVYGVPDKIQFNQEEIRQINQNYTLVKRIGEQHRVVNGPMLRKISELKKESCRFETENELEVGDRVKFSYMVHLTAKENNAIFDTTEGKMYFIRYDDIFMVVDARNVPKKMINGYILVDPDVLELKKEGGMEYVEKDELILPQLGENRKQRRGMKCMEGKVLLAGEPLTVFDELLGKKRMGGYFDIEGYREKNIPVNTGDRLLFDPRIAQQLEHNNHQAIGDHKLFMIQRKDILLMEKDNKEVFEEIGMDKVNYQ